jgi:Domain of unknown function (DUF4365)
MTQRPVRQKRRTRQHVIATLSVNHVERFIVEAGHTVERVEQDYGYDLFVSTFDEEGYMEPGLVFVQVKATDAPRESSAGTEVAFDLSIKDFNLWIHEPMPVVLVLYDAQARRAWWLYLQRYFAQDETRLPRKGSRTIRVLMPKSQRFGRRTVMAMQMWKRDLLRQLWGRIGHA